MSIANDNPDATQCLAALAAGYSILNVIAELAGEDAVMTLMQDRNRNAFAQYVGERAIEVCQQLEADGRA